MSNGAGVFAISATGMQLERLRLEVAAQNLANANSVTGSQGEPYRALRVVGHASSDTLFEGKLSSVSDLSAGLAGVARFEVLPTGGEPRLEHDPGNPLADANGMVRVPNIDVSNETLTVLSAVRAYDADVKAMAAAKAIAMKALEIGSGA